MMSLACVLASKFGVDVEAALYEIPMARVGFMVAEACRESGKKIGRPRNNAAYFEAKRRQREAAIQ